MSVLPHRIRTFVKVPYNLAKFYTVKFLKNFNVKISMKFSRRENFMKFSITTPNPWPAEVVGSVGTRPDQNSG